jgi:DNA repair exonuclease SbcCD ATPase subunit
VFDILEVRFNNFKSFAGEHTFTLPHEPGLYFLTGKNQKDPKLESNGAGKSTILDGITWCLYGWTLRGLRGPDIITWGASSASVEIDIRIGEVLHNIKRVQNPNSITLDGNVVDEATVESTIGLNTECYVRSVVMPQFNTAFLDLTPSSKLALFSIILNLGEWETYSEHAKLQAGDIDFEIKNKNQQIGAIQLVLEATKKDIDLLQDKDETFVSEFKNEIKHLKEVVSTLKNEGAEIEKSLTKAEETYSLIKQDIDAIQLDIIDIENKKDAIAIRMNERQKDYHIAATENEAAFLAHEAINKVGAECPTCLQEVNAKHLKNEIKAATVRLVTSRKNFLKEEKLSEKIHAELTDIMNVRADLLAKAKETKNEELAAQRKVFLFTKDLGINAAKIEAAIAAVSNQKQRANPYSNQIEYKKEVIKENRAKQNKLTQEVTASVLDHEAVSFWITGFKRIRLLVITETLAQLEIEVNNSLAGLGLGGWAITFDVERENKSGGITKGFIALIQAPNSPEAVRWETYSGGEAQRLKLAADLGLANLIMRRAGMVNTVEFYDEPSKHLSKAGLVDLAETLHQRAIDDDKRIFLVDHNMPEFGDFASVITVTKNKEGHSSIT